VYKAPKLMPVQYDDNTVKKANKDRARLEKKLKNSEMIKTYKDMMGDEPEELASIGTEIRQAKFLKENEEMEEDMFNRRSLSKKEKKMIMKEREKHLSGFDELRHFESSNDLENLKKYAQTKTASNTKVTLAHYSGNADQAIENLERMNEKAAEDDTLDDEENYLRTSGVLVDIGDGDDDDEEDEDEPVPAPKKNKKTSSSNSGKRKREQQEAEDDSPAEYQQKSKKKKMSQRDEEDALLEEDQRDANGKRVAPKHIVENKGLVNRTKKSMRNSRVKHKNKYKNKAGSLLKQQKIQKGGQDGSIRSINRSVVRSKKIN
jgi:hypothetical protein